MTLRVAVFAHDRPNNLAGGPNSWLQRLVPDLIANGFMVTTIVIGFGEAKKCPLVVDFTSRGYPVRFLDSAGKSHFLEHRIRWIVEQINDLQPDVIVPNTVVAAYFAAGWARKFGIPAIGVIHSNDIFHRHLSEMFVYGQEFQRLDAAVAVSDYLRQDLLRRSRGDVIVRRIACGVPVPSDVTRPKSNLFRVAYVGRFRQQQKRILDVTLAFCMASKELTNAVFTLLGDGPELANMQKIIVEFEAQDSVFIHDSIAPSQVLDFMQTQEVFVLLSDYEGLPIALMEAMACGVVPVCMKEDSGISELIVHGKNGLIVNDRTLEFVEALCVLAHDREMLAKLSEQARHTILKQYSSEDLHGKWMSLIKEVASVGKKKKIRLPLNLKLPLPHISFRNEDLRAPARAEVAKHYAKKKWLNFRQLVRPRSRLRSVWQHFSKKPPL